MVGIIIDTITSLAKVAMILGIILLSCWGIYEIYNKHEKSKTLGDDSNIVDRATKSIIKFAFFLANKLK